MDTQCASNVTVPLANEVVGTSNSSPPWYNVVLDPSTNAQPVKI